MKRISDNPYTDNALNYAFANGKGAQLEADKKAMWELFEEIKSHISREYHIDLEMDSGWQAIMNRHLGEE